MSAGSATFILKVLVVVDIRFTEGGVGLARDCGGRLVGRGAVVIRGVTVGKRFIRGTLGWKLEGGKEAICLGGKGRGAGLTVY